MTEQKQENREPPKGKDNRDGRGSCRKVLVCVGGKVFGINDIFAREK